MLTIISFIIVIGIVIFVHELGHFLAARSVGIRVEAFSLGYPPTALRRRRGDTEYRLGWIPFGGYVKMAGMIDEGLDGASSLTGAPWEFQSKNAWQKLWVITAGVIMNLLLGVLIYTGVTAVRGVAEPRGAYVGAVTPGDPAERAGLQLGDRIVSVDGVAVTTWEELVAQIYPRPDEELEFVYEREGATQSVAIRTARRVGEVDGEVKEVGLIGINPEFVYRPAHLGEVLSAGFVGTAWVVRLVGTSLRMLVSGEASLRDLRGPMQIAQMSGQSARQGLTAFLGFIAFISVNIGCVNLLPVPALDGGHAVIILSEAVIRREIPAKAKMAIQQAGMLLLLALIAFILINDAQSIFGFGWVKKLF